MIEITTTCTSQAQARALLEAGADVLLIGEADFSLRLPSSFSREAQADIVSLAHEYGKKVSVAVNAIMHPDDMKKIPEYLTFLDQIGVDRCVIGDPGVIYVLDELGLSIPFVYDGETMVTSARQINFWGKKGAIGAVIAREVPFEELKMMADQLEIFGEILVYGPTCIHHSKRKLVRNFFSYIGAEESVGKERGLFISEPEDPTTHYAIYEDVQGTHIFANNDILLTSELKMLVDYGYTHWKLDGLYTPEAEFVKIVALYAKAKAMLHLDQFTEEKGAAMKEQVRKLHPEERGLDTGFFYLDPDAIK